ncbi:hypothetical protein, conserved [Eimeria brunetti]|uniref:Uncharacterized protein n=1 Tax=Eimeria brunetti TaxID=51314 RepID=U6LCR7_9EIME|nr:hypothetical protein, conserved [Eimeria brunetti]
MLLGAEMEEERQEKSERASKELRLQIEALNERFNEQDKLLFSNIGALSLKNKEAKAHYQQHIQGLQKQLQAAERDVVGATKCAWSFFLGLRIQDTAEKLAERISMSQGSWAAEQKRMPLEMRMKHESPIGLGTALEHSEEGEGPNVMRIRGFE